jgi:hypothetical protein
VGVALCCDLCLIQDARSSYYIHTIYVSRSLFLHPITLVQAAVETRNKFALLSFNPAGIMDSSLYLLSDNQNQSIHNPWLARLNTSQPLLSSFQLPP